MPDERLGGLAAITDPVVVHVDRVPGKHLRAFIDAGFGKREALEVLTIFAVKTLGDTTKQGAALPVDDACADRAW